MARSNRPRSKNAKPRAIGIERDERVAEVHCRGGLSDGDPFRAPFGEQRVNLCVVGRRDGDLATGVGGRRFDAVALP